MVHEGCRDRERFIYLLIYSNKLAYFQQVWFIEAVLPKVMDRSSRPEIFYKKSVLRNFTKFTGKHLYQRLFFNKVAGLRPANLLKKSHWHRCLPFNFAKFLRTPFFKEHLQWLVLHRQVYFNLKKTLAKTLTNTYEWIHF